MQRNSPSLGSKQLWEVRQVVTRAGPRVPAPTVVVLGEVMSALLWQGQQRAEHGRALVNHAVYGWMLGMGLSWKKTNAAVISAYSDRARYLRAHQYVKLYLWHGNLTASASAVLLLASCKKTLLLSLKVGLNMSEQRSLPISSLITWKCFRLNTSQAT